MYTETGPGWSHNSCHSCSPGREVLGVVICGEVCLRCLLLIHVAAIYTGFQAEKKSWKAKLYESLLAASSYVQICYVRRPSASERFQDSFHDPCLCSGQDEQPNGAPLQRTSCNQQQMTSML